MMKKKITLQLSDEILGRLKGATEQRCVNRAVLIEKALERFLAEPADPLPQQDRLAGLERQLESITCDLRALNDTVALHARYHLALTSLGRDNGPDASANKASSAARVDDVEEQTREQARGVGFLDQQQKAEELPFGAPTRRTRPVLTAAPTTEVSWGMPAAEEGGEDPFRLASHEMR
ncbi:hypothetical protein [Bradyrhizobium sp. HKCCYLS20291]|uniref:hypothetical protein n=1 Tax=Bradyrhizobium sp. HKCCYLS20291 TaxID=3420766 RepID=UPI003EC05D6B